MNHLRIAAFKYGLAAARHGLVIVEADADTFTVADPLFPDHPGFIITHHVMHYVVDKDIPLADASRRIAHQGGAQV